MLEQSVRVEDLNVLLVEPSAAQRRIIISEMQAAGVRKIDGIANGSDALAAIRLRAPDLVASAMYLQDMTGAELLTAMRQQSVATDDIPFMLVSSERYPGNLEPVRQAGVMAILPKPFRPRDLQTALVNALDFVEPRRLELDYADVEDIRVLVVDDSALSRRFLLQTFAQLGLERITEAANGAEAVRALGEQRFDLVVTDYNMPQMDGQRLVEYIRNESDDPTVPVFMVTCERDSVRLGSIRQSGVSALCDKPFDMQTVRSILSRLLN